jgi:hypothetical protein
MPQCQYCHAINKADSDKCSRCGNKLKEEMVDREKIFTVDGNVRDFENGGSKSIPSALDHFSAKLPEL